MLIPQMTRHGEFRAAQRNISQGDIEFIVKYGKRIHRAGVIFYQLPKNRIPKDVAPNDRRWKLHGTTILLCRCGVSVITVYRNPKAFKKDRSKKEYNKKENQSCRCKGCKHKTDD